MRLPRQAMATLDQSKLSEKVLYYLPALLRYGDEVVLVTVGRPPQPTPRGAFDFQMPIVVGSRVETLEPIGPAYAEDTEHAIERIKSELKDYLEDRAIALRNEGFAVRPLVLLSDRPAHAIIDCAREIGPLFIAMATHGHGGLSHAVSGSIAEAVVKSGVAPVLLVRP